LILSNLTLDILIFSVYNTLTMKCKRRKIDEVGKIGHLKKSVHHPFDWVLLPFGGGKTAFRRGISTFGLGITKFRRGKSAFGWGKTIFGWGKTAFGWGNLAFGGCETAFRQEPSGFPMKTK
jgi:hypothetical protein